MDICNGNLLGIKTVNKLTFEEHVDIFLMRFKQRKPIVNSFTTPHFSYCLLVWMFQKLCLNNHINHISFL